MDFKKLQEELKPDTSVLKKIDAFVDDINTRIKLRGIKAACVKGGSVAKGTFLKGDFDVDLFVRFDYSYKDKQLSDLLENILDDLPNERVHGSRDYFQLEHESLNYELVPVLDINDPKLALNVTDMSPLHVDWVKKHLQDDMEDEIRLAKKFCKAQGVYGAESYISGFSGHVMDILIIHYGSFLKMLEHAVKWKKKQIVDVESYYKGSREVLFNMNQSKITGPLIVVDPILKSRNAASALSLEKFNLFKKQAASFLKKPDSSFFEEVFIGKTYLKEKHKKDLVIMEAAAKDGKRDVVGSKILKVYKHLRSGLQKRGFTFKDSGWSWNRKKKVLMWFLTDKMELPEEMEVQGPPVSMKEACSDFKKHYDDIFKDKERMYAKVKVAKRDIEDNIEELMHQPYAKERLTFSKTEKYK